MMVWRKKIRVNQVDAELCSINKLCTGNVVHICSKLVSSIGLNGVALQRQALKFVRLLQACNCVVVKR